MQVQQLQQRLDQARGDAQDDVTHLRGQLGEAEARVQGADNVRLLLEAQLGQAMAIAEDEQVGQGGEGALGWECYK